ncbi:MAG: peptidoglycan DD-metalloendopeptidase family protein [Bacteroidetes bacterium]|nr:peptidoglycan DD-metalloendopeptidase family protein [Bacteroidota bacterium]
MVKNIKYSFLVYFLVSIFFVGLSQQKKIEQKKEELFDIKKEIRLLENQYKQKSKKEKKSYSSFLNFNKQNYLLNKLIGSLKKQEAEKEKQIKRTKNDISKLEKEIKSLRKNYSKYVVSIYKYGQPSEWSIFFDLSSLQRLFLRYKYLKEFSKRRKKDLDKLKTSKAILQNLKIKLDGEKREKQLLVRQKQKEEKDLLKKIRESKKILRVIRINKSELKKEISAKKIAKERISKLITKLIEEERKRGEEERLARLNTKNDINYEPGDYNVDLSTTGFSSFASLKGRMRWPVKKGKVIKKFGKNRNKRLNTVTVNYGIDIKVFSDLNVKSVAEGVVSAIDWIPGYGSIVIVSHKDNYRTVYSHLDKIFVSEGDHINYNFGIGKVGESIDGFVLHFEIWKSRKNQNPEVWLAKR